MPGNLNPLLGKCLLPMDYPSMESYSHVKYLPPPTKKIALRQPHFSWKFPLKCYLWTVPGKKKFLSALSFKKVVFNIIPEIPSSKKDFPQITCPLVESCSRRKFPLENLFRRKLLREISPVKTLLSYGDLFYIDPTLLTFNLPDNLPDFHGNLSLRTC